MSQENIAEEKEPALTLKVKLVHENARTPTKAHASDLGWDIAVIDDRDWATSDGYWLQSGQTKLFRTGIHLGLPHGYGLILKDRSGLASKDNIHVLGGVVDQNYTGEIKVILTNLGKSPKLIKNGDRIAQAIIVPIIHLKTEVVGYLDNTDRSSSGFGSSGN